MTQIHRDLACIPLDHDWATLLQFHQELKRRESAGGKGATTPIIYEKPALISFNMYIVRSCRRGENCSVHGMKLDKTKEVLGARGCTVKQSNKR